MKVVVACFSSVERLAAFIAALAIFFMMLITVADVIGRHFFKHPLPGAYEISEFMLIGIVFLSVAYVQSLRQNARVGMLVDRLHKRARLALVLFGDVIGLSVFSLMAWQGVLLALRAWQTKEYAGGGAFFCPLLAGEGSVHFGSRPFGPAACAGHCQ